MIYGEINLTTDPSTGVSRKSSTWLILVMYGEINRARIDDSIIVIKPRFHLVSFIKYMGITETKNFNALVMSPYSDQVMYTWQVWSQCFPIRSEEKEVGYAKVFYWY